MTQAQAVAEVFLTAFHALPKVQQNRIIAVMVRDPHLREDLIDLAIAETRSKEPYRPLRTFLHSLNRPQRRV